MRVQVSLHGVSQTTAASASGVKRDFARTQLGQSSRFFNLGPHPPRLWPEDVDLLHDIWLKLSESEQLGARLHHRDIVGVALRRLRKDLENSDRDHVVAEVQRELRHD